MHGDACHTCVHDSISSKSSHIYRHVTHTHTHAVVVHTRALSLTKKRESFITVPWMHIDPWFYNTWIVICIYASHSSFGWCLSSSSSSSMTGRRRRRCRRHDQNRNAVGANAGMDDALSRCLCKQACIVFSY